MVCYLLTKFYTNL
uniref:Uncharacterized protein n=1 Tax=Arundo donax TaxID=35708 RepID=A0A0A9ABG9_ARUDO